MADYWQRVTVQARTTTYTASGAEADSYADRHTDIEARVSPMAWSEDLQQWATPEEQAHEVALRGAQLQVEPRDRLLVDGVAYDVREVITPPPFGTPTTVLHVVRVLP